MVELTFTLEVVLKPKVDLQRSLKLAMNSSKSVERAPVKVELQKPKF